MPQVPMRNAQTLQAQAMPTPRVSVNAPIEAFGGGQDSEQLLNTANSIIAQRQKFMDDQRQKADDIATTEAYSRLLQSKNNFLYHPEMGVYKKTGKAAAGIINEDMPKFQKSIIEIESTLNGDQKYLFKPMAIKVTSDVDEAVQKHIFSESVKYDNSVSKTSLQEIGNDILNNYQNPAKIEEGLKMQDTVIMSNATRNGKPMNEAVLESKQVRSKTLSDVIERMLINGNYDAAKAYYSKVKENGMILAEDAIPIEKSLETESITYESDRIATSLVGSSNTQYEAIQKARQISDQRLKDAVISDVKSRYSEINAIKKQDADNMYLKANEYMQNNPGANPMKVIPAPIMSKLSYDQQKSFYAINNPGKSNKAWASFMELSQDEIAGLSLSDFNTKYWSGMSKQNRDQATGIWNAAKEQKGPELTKTMSFHDMNKNALINAGIIPVKDLSEPEAERLNTFEQASAKALEEFEIRKGGKATQQETQKIVDDLTTKKVFIEKGFSKDKESLIALINQDKKDKAYIPIKLIPADDIKSIKEDAKKLGVSIDNKKIEKAYGAYLLGDSDLYIKHLRGN